MTLRAFLFLTVIFFSSFGWASDWNLEPMFQAPKAIKAEGFSEEGLVPYFFDGPAWRGKPTKVFAWYGAPTLGTGKKHPAMVLIHGGGGTAFAEWVRLWNKRGYAAIAMDTTGCTPKGSGSSAARVRHDAAGPDGWGGFLQTNDVWTDQWPYHAVAAVVGAHSLLRSFPEVDSDRVGVTGISWGGYLTCMVAGLDPRFKLAMPVYGCGFYHEDSAWTGTLRSLGAKGVDWVARFDASKHLPKASLPMLWVDGTGDHFFPMPSVQKSYRLPSGPRTLCMRVNMAHSHPDGWAPSELGAFADQVLLGKSPLPKITAQGGDSGKAWVTWDAGASVVLAEFHFTADGGVWEHRWWQTTGARLDPAGRTATAEVPPEATAYFMTVVDSRGLLVSSEHVERTPTAVSATGRRVLIDENYEGRTPGSVPVGVVGAVPEKGATIAVSEEGGPFGLGCLKFADAPGLAKAWEPLREFKFTGPRSLTNGKVTLSFAFRNTKARPARLTVELRDQSRKPYATGPILDFLPGGKLQAGETPLADLKPETWTRVQITFRPAKAAKEYDLEVTPEGGKAQLAKVPYKSGDFGGANWLGFILYNEAEAVCFLDDLKLVVEAD